MLGMNKYAILLTCQMIQILYLMLKPYRIFSKHFSRLRHLKQFKVNLLKAGEKQDVSTGLKSRFN